MLDAVETLPEYVGPVRILPLEEQADLVESVGADTLLYCPDPWALRHRFINHETGEVIRARCDKWDCLYCGPRKVNQWRKLVAAAEPTLFVTLTKVGKTVEEAARVLTTVIQRLRRGFKSCDPERKGYREAYLIEYFAVLERHSDFEENGFHWHLLIKGVDFLPNQVVSEALRSATKGRSYITKVEAVRSSKSIGYVTKYLTKAISRLEKGIREEVREIAVPVKLDEQDHEVLEKRVCTVQVVSKARRIRYSRHFFPEPVKELRARLMAVVDGVTMVEQNEQTAREQPGEAVSVKQSEDGFVEQNRQKSESPLSEQDEIDTLNEKAGHPARSRTWFLWEKEEYSHEVKVYKQRKREALLEALGEVRARQRRLSGRVISIWTFQRKEVSRWAS
jgi:hypothetical protein